MDNKSDSMERGPVPAGRTVPTRTGRATSAARTDAVIEALGSGRTHQETADVLGVTTKTIQRTLADPTIRARVATRRRERMEEITGLLIYASAGWSSTASARSRKCPRLPYCDHSREAARPRHAERRGTCSPTPLGATER